MYGVIFLLQVLRLIVRKSRKKVSCTHVAGLLFDDFEGLLFNCFVPFDWLLSDGDTMFVLWLSVDQKIQDRFYLSQDFITYRNNNNDFAIFECNFS